MKRYDEAKQEYERVLQLDNSSAMGLTGMGRTLLLLNDAEKCLETYERLLRIEDKENREEAVLGVATCLTQMVGICAARV